MGYYDQTEMSTRFEEKPQRRSRKGYFFSGFVGAVIGAVAVTASINYIPALQNNEGQASVVQQVQQSEGTAVPVVKNMKETDLAGMIQGAKEAVVGVINYQTTDVLEAQDSEVGSGSGVVYKKVGNKALVITNNHVVEGAKRLEVKLANGEKIAAKLVGSDRWLDLAVVEVDGTNIKTIATLGDSDKVRVGEQAIAIGNPIGLDGTVTVGIISSKDREIPVDIDQDGRADWQAQVLQTDASINPGNSGGALFNDSGEVIGINSSKIAQESVEGIGFAIPINVAKPIVESLEKYGEVQRPFLGVQLRSLNELSTSASGRLNLPAEVTDGVIILQTTANSPAAKAGLQQYDVVIALDGQEVKDSVQFRKYLYEKKKIGDEMKVSFYRDGQKYEETIKLDANAD